MMCSKNKDDMETVEINEENIDVITELLDLEFRDGILYFEGENDPVRCESCDGLITKENLGTIAPGENGEKLVYCERVTCFVSYVVEHLESE